MKLTPLEDVATLKEIATLHKLNSLTKEPHIPSVFELITLSVKLIYKANLIIHAKLRSTKTAQAYHSEALKILNAIKSYDTRYFTVDEVLKIKSDFK